MILQIPGHLKLKKKKSVGWMTVFRLPVIQQANSPELAFKPLVHPITGTVICAMHNVR